MKKILITGSSGFIGTNLIEKLRRRDDIKILGFDLKPPKLKSHNVYWKKVDICNREQLEKEVKTFEPNYIIHLAARTDLNGKKIHDYDSNIGGVKNLISSISKLDRIERAVFASSMYVCEPGYSPNDENDYSPHTVYGESKVLTEKIIKSSNLNIEWVIIRPTSIWGPWFGEPYNNFFKIVLSKKFYHLGDKACNKTYGFVDNSIYQIMQLLTVDINRVHKKVFYIGDWPAYNISEWANEISNEIGEEIKKLPFWSFKILALFGGLLAVIKIKFPMTSFRLRNMTTDNVFDLSEIKEIAPELVVNRKEGVKKTIDWIKEVE